MDASQNEDEKIGNGAGGDRGASTDEEGPDPDATDPDYDAQKLRPDSAIPPKRRNNFAAGGTL